MLSCHKPGLYICVQVDAPCMLVYIYVSCVLHGSDTPDSGQTHNPRACGPFPPCLGHGLVVSWVCTGLSPAHKNIYICVCTRPIGLFIACIQSNEACIYYVTAYKLYDIALFGMFVLYHGIYKPCVACLNVYTSQVACFLCI